MGGGGGVAGADLGRPARCHQGRACSICTLMPPLPMCPPLPVCHPGRRLLTTRWAARRRRSCWTLCSRPTGSPPTCTPSLRRCTFTTSPETRWHGKGSRRSSRHGSSSSRRPWLQGPRRANSSRRSSSSRDSSRGSRQRRDSSRWTSACRGAASCRQGGHVHEPASGSGRSVGHELLPQ